MFFAIFSFVVLKMCNSRKVTIEEINVLLDIVSCDVAVISISSHKQLRRFAHILQAPNVVRLCELVQDFSFLINPANYFSILTASYQETTFLNQYHVLNSLRVGSNNSRWSKVTHIPKSDCVIIGSGYQNKLIKNHRCYTVCMTFHLCN